MILVTNNPKVFDDLTIDCPKLFIEGSYGDVLTAVRDKIHIGHKLLTHPLSGSVKPNETPYKSVLISKRPADLNLDSLILIENSIAVYEKFMRNPIKIGDTNQERLLKDYREVDHRLITAALSSASSK